MSDIMMTWPEFQNLQAMTPAQFLSTLLGYLATKHTRQNAVASWLLVKAGPGFVPTLVREAVSPGKHPDHRIRLLDIVQKIGAPLDIDSFMTLTAARARSQKVGMKIAEVVVALRGARQPHPATAALPSAPLVVGKAPVFDSGQRLTWEHHVADRTAASLLPRSSGL